MCLNNTVVKVCIICMLQGGRSGGAQLDVLTAQGEMNLMVSIPVLLWIINLFVYIINLRTRLVMLG